MQAIMIGVVPEEERDSVTNGATVSAGASASEEAQPPVAENNSDGLAQ